MNAVPNTLSEVPPYSDPFPHDSSSKNEGLSTEAFIITGAIVAVLFIITVIIAIYCIKKSYKNGKLTKASGEYMVNLGDEMVDDNEEEDETGNYQSPTTIIV